MCISPCSPEFEQATADLVECGLAVAAGASDPYLLLKYAEALWTVRDTQATIAILDRAIAAAASLPPYEHSKAYASRAICEMQNGSLEQALVDVERSLEVMPRPHPYALRAMIHHYLGNAEQAIADVNESIRRDPSDWEAPAWRGLILVTAGRYAEAIADFTRVIDSGECEKYASELYLGRARAHLALGDAAAAEADCATCIDLDYHEQAHWPFIVPSRARQAHAAYLVRAEARLALSETNLALGDCFFAAILAPADPAIYDLRARVYHAIGNLPEAMRDMMRAAHLRRQSGESEIDGAPAGEPTLTAAGG